MREWTESLVNGIDPEASPTKDADFTVASRGVELRFHNVRTIDLVMTHVVDLSVVAAPAGAFVAVMTRPELFPAWLVFVGLVVVLIATSVSFRMVLERRKAQR